MPQEGVSLTPNEQLLTKDEILRLARLFVSQGIKKIRLTGGEPTIRKDLMDIMAGLNALRPLGLQTIGITSNGIVLKKKLEELKANGLNQVNISIDTLDKFKFELITRRKGFDHVMDSIHHAIACDFPSVKLNVVVIRNVNDNEVLDFVEMTRDLPIYIRFIEYMPFDGNRWNKEKFLPYQEMLQRIENKFPGVAKLTNEANDTSKAYQVPGFKGKFGFITSMSEHFCGTCNRLRLLADGNMKVCLFGKREVNLRDLIRNGSTDEQLLTIIEAAASRSPTLQYTHLRYYTTNSKATESEMKPSSETSSSNNQASQPKLTHVDEKGTATMVNISQKPLTHRQAKATSRVIFSSQDSFHLLQTNSIKKGDVLTVAKLAGINAAKQTGFLIPLAHPISLTNVDLGFKLVEEERMVFVEASVECVGRTGVEVEAMVACSIAACTVFDMCKGVDKRIRIEETKVTFKSGGKSGVFVA
ncbi:Molybdenum cofactor synthesis protein 1 [Blyttiomyces sp. JEL0837]|nr:Molybdenum cofactor synthesis protein 1 [Blyttiomyces sp. JEL0837]